MKFSEIGDLKIGSKVRCKLDDASEHNRWFTGKILDIRYRTPNDSYRIVIERDDMISSSWYTDVNRGNACFIDLLDFEWNEEENLAI